MVLAISLDCKGMEVTIYGTGCLILVPVPYRNRPNGTQYHENGFFLGRYHCLPRFVQCNAVPVHGKSFAFVFLGCVVCALLCKGFEFAVVVLLLFRCPSFCFVVVLLFWSR